MLFFQKYVQIFYKIISFNFAKRSGRNISFALYSTFYENCITINKK